MRETRVRSLGWEDPLEKEMAIHSRTVAWKIPWTEEPGRLQPVGSQRVGRDWATSLSLSCTKRAMGEVGGVLVQACLKGNLDKKIRAQLRILLSPHTWTYLFLPSERHSCVFLPREATEDPQLPFFQTKRSVLAASSCWGGAALLAFGAGSLFVGGGCPMHGDMFSSIPGPCPWDACTTPEV